MLELNCPTCGSHLTVPPSFRGQMRPCDHCHQPMYIRQDTLTPAQQRMLAAVEAPVDLPFAPPPTPGPATPAPAMAMPAAPARSRWIYVLLGLLFGLFGIHNFYAGRNTAATLQLILTLFFGWLVVPIFFVLAWVLLEIIFVTRDAHGAPLL